MKNFERPINIHSIGTTVHLLRKQYIIYILGGFSVRLGAFKMNFRNTNTNEFITTLLTKKHPQTYLFDKRATLIFQLNIPVRGEYEIIFDHPETLKVEKSNLVIQSLFMKPVSNFDLEIAIQEINKS